MPGGKLKTTIKIDAGKSIVIEPNKQGVGVIVSLVLFGASLASATLTPDQCGAMMAGLEFAGYDHAAPGRTA